ncbi:restriction endonuclease fold toxin-2 domain-containing protein [Streptomyces sp. NPDC059455]|uniref:restriction endonuclease fold toxin-2 domain-containing protein n=1 Tax=Streptomyces sp. NPDC059455 TaxID=3346837 RepID=UPI0036B0665A
MRPWWEQLPWWHCSPNSWAANDWASRDARSHESPDYPSVRIRHRLRAGQSRKGSTVAAYHGLRWARRADELRENHEKGKKDFLYRSDPDELKKYAAALNDPRNTEMRGVETVTNNHESVQAAAPRVSVSLWRTARVTRSPTTWVKAGDLKPGILRCGPRKVYAWNAGLRESASWGTYCQIDMQVTESAPRTRGDGPMGRLAGWCLWSCSPHLRGWSHAAVAGLGVLELLPARAGMVPRSRPSPSPAVPAPRTRRGWSPGLSPVEAALGLLPAPAGMVPTRRRTRSGWRAAPRACGDGPKAMGLILQALICSPNPGGWSSSQLPPHCGGLLLPASAGSSRARLWRIGSCRWRGLHIAHDGCGAWEILPWSQGQPLLRLTPACG